MAVCRTSESPAVRGPSVGGAGSIATGNALGQGLALALQQIVAGLGALELALHQPQRLARGEDGLSGLEVGEVSTCA